MLHYIKIHVSDLSRTRAFYQDLRPRFGYEFYQEWADGFSMKIAEHYIVFVQTPAEFLEAGYHRCRTGLNHLAFQGGSQEDIDQLREELRAKGIRLLCDDRYLHAGGLEHYALYFEDPDGVKIEIIGKETTNG